MWKYLWFGLILTVLYRSAVFLYNRVIGRKPKNLKKLGEWAVITGATDGIGKAFVEYFAEKKMNVVLVSRSSEKLATVAEEVESKYKVKSKIIQADFSSLDESMYRRIGNEIEGLDIGVLVNNVGVSYAHPEYFLELKTNHENLYDDIINCNITSTVNMCRLVLPGMASRERGWIINLSSGLADIPAPLLTLYAASKSFISKFSQDLGIEYSSKNISVQWLKPGLVATNMSAIKKTSWMVPSPKSYVKSAIDDLSYNTCSEGCFSHTLLIRGTSALCTMLPSLMSGKLLGITLNTRKKALKRCTPCAKAS